MSYLLGQIYHGFMECHLLTDFCCCIDLYSGTGNVTRLRRIFMNHNELTTCYGTVTATVTAKHNSNVKHDNE